MKKQNRPLMLLVLVSVLAAGLFGCANTAPVYDPVMENVSFVLDPLGHIMFRHKMFCDTPGCDGRYYQPGGYGPYEGGPPPTAPYYQNNQ